MRLILGTASVEAMKNAKYGSSLTDAQWKYLQPMLPKPAKRGRPRIDLRRMLDAILYVVKAGVPWRYLPGEFPLWQTVYGLFRRWQRGERWAALNEALRTLTRISAGRERQPTAAILDSQSVKSAGHRGQSGL
jgi:putative transposase